MKVKRFEAPDTQSALALVKAELGEEAVILSTRSLPPAAGQGRRVEVVAARDFDAESLLHQARERETEANARQQPAPFPRLSPPAKPSRAPKPVRRTANHALPSHGMDARGRQQRFARLLDPPSPPPAARLDRPVSSGRTAPARPDPQAVARWRRQIIDRLTVGELPGSRDDGPTVIALVGPTGVGKTTTAAKLAAWYSLQEGRRVALATMDCYRIGATDQLRTYARIMRLPCEVALSRQDLAWSLRRHRDKEIIILDTAGKSPFDPDHVEELRDWFSPYPSLSPYLVLSATAKKEDLQQTLRCYQPLAVQGLVLSKLDETRAYAALCQQTAASGLPITCLCTGQRVPEDFLPAAKDFLHSLFGQGFNAAMMHNKETGQGAWLQ